MSQDKPYLIIPKLIQQPTWGGEYIVKLKKFDTLPFMTQYKIGQSYELFSGTKLFTAGDKTTHEKFLPEIGYADHEDTVIEHFPLEMTTDYITLSKLIDINPEQILGPSVINTYGKMPLLIKINHARGNSFQLHIKPGLHDARWQPKPESWYYLEKGLLTCGIKPNISVADYKKTCLAIDTYMHDLSTKIKDNGISIDEARIQAKSFIQTMNPWQFVHVLSANKFDVFDMSAGGLHHSWEEDAEKLPIGNVIYEVQHDRMDPVSTIRSFDQGKIKNDGSVRELAIDDYFSYLDTEPITNSPDTVLKKIQGARAIATKYYSMDVISITGKLHLDLTESFHHIFVREGEVSVTTDGGTVHLGQGHSSFIPFACNSYEINSHGGTACVLKTYIGEQQ